MVEVVNVADVVEANGKTVRENNIELEHKIPVGSLVEITGDRYWNEWHGCRLYVLSHGRDCDGSPLYTLGHKNASALGFERHSGFGEESLTVVEPPPFEPGILDG